MNQSQAQDDFEEAVLLVKEGNGVDGWSNLDVVWQRQRGYIQQLEHKIVLLNQQLLNAQRRNL